MLLRQALSQVRRETQKRRQDFSLYSSLIDTPDDLSVGFNLPAGANLYIKTDEAIDEATVLINAGTRDIGVPFTGTPAETTVVNQTDDFNRANEASLGGNWSIRNGDMALISNKLAAVSGGFGVASRNDVTFDTTTHSSKAVLVSGAGTGPAVCVGATGDCYYFSTDGNDLSIWVKHGGTFLSQGSATDPNGSEYKMRSEEDNIILSVDDVDVLTVANGLSLVGQPGMTIYSNVLWDNWEGDGGVVVPATPQIENAHHIGWYERAVSVAKDASAPGTVSIYIRNPAGALVLIAQG